MEKKQKFLKKKKKSQQDKKYSKYMEKDQRDYLANILLTLRRRQSRSILKQPYCFRGLGKTFLANSEGIVDITSKSNHVLAYLHAIWFGLSTRRYVALSRYATKNVKMISIAKNPLTTLSVIERAIEGSSRNPNSNGETHAVQKTKNTRNVSQTLQI